MGDLAAKLQEELTCETVFQIGDIGIAESTVITWVIMAVLLIFALFMTHNLRVDNISKRQAAAEFIVVKLNSMVEGMIGKENRKYVPYLVTVLLYIGVSNVIGLFGVKPPTKDLNVTAALAIMSIILIEAAGIVKRGVKGWCKNFAEPIAIVAPINVLEIFIRPLSLKRDIDCESAGKPESSQRKLGIYHSCTGTRTADPHRGGCQLCQKIIMCYRKMYRQ